MPKEKEIRAVYDSTTIRVYQAYNDAIADSALKHSTFVSPPFKMDRMTWIKPSFLWMMYRAGWGHKDDNQKRILAIDISRDGFDWILNNACLSHFDPDVYESKEDWEIQKKEKPVVIQWDPERAINLQPLSFRSIQIGLKGTAVVKYTNEWIKKISDITPLAHEIHRLIENKDTEKAKLKLPEERTYPIPDGCSIAK